MFCNIFSKHFKKKKQSWLHIFSASLIIVYWWALWNILDHIFLDTSFSLYQIIILSTTIIISIGALIIFDFDLSEL